MLRLNPRFLPTAVLLVVALSGCEGTGGSPDDPYQGMNRQVYAFNKAVDETVLRPVAQGYQAIVPDFVDDAISNFFGNLNDIQNAINNFLQLKITDSFEDVGRLAINSTIGVAGLIDIASGVGIPKHAEDFGQTLGRWGVSPGPYLVLPFFGSSSVRDTIGTGVDYLTDPMLFIGDDLLEFSLKGVRVIDRRSDLAGAERIVGAAALDEYNFVRDAYLQRRRSQVYDGDAPFQPQDE